MKIFILTLAFIAFASGNPSRNLRSQFEASWIPVASDSGDKIVGGSITGKPLPYQISLQLKVPGGWAHICGGTIARPKVVITAAHCVNDFEPSELRVVVGEYDLSVDGDESSIHNVASKIVHHSYNTFTLKNDIALLGLSTKMTFQGDDNVAAALFANLTVPADSTLVTVSGWGATSEGGSLPDKLHSVTVPIVNDAECSSAYPGQYYEKEMFCAGLSTGGKDSCQGDSGGPVVHNGNLIGVVSWGIGCARPGYYGVYTRVSNYRTWAGNNLSKL